MPSEGFVKLEIVGSQSKKECPRFSTFTRIQIAPGLSEDEQTWGLRVDSQSVRSEKIIHDWDLLRDGRSVVVLKKYKVDQPNSPESGTKDTKHYYLDHKAVYSFKELGD